MKVDMSPRAVKGRLKLVGRLWRLSVALGEAKRKSDEPKKKATTENFKAEVISNIK